MELTDEEQRRKAGYLLQHGVGKLFEDILHKVLVHEPSEPKEFIRRHFFDGPERKPSMPNSHGNSGDSQLNVWNQDASGPRRGSLRRSSKDNDSLSFSRLGKNVRILSDSCGPEAMPTSPKNAVGQEPHNNPRGRAALRKAQREKFLELYTRHKDTECQSNFKCCHIGTVAVALSLFLDAKRTSEGAEDDGANHQVIMQNPTVREFSPWTVTVEDIFFLLRLPLHYLRNSKMTLSELHDIAADFIQADFRLQGIAKASVRHFDTQRAGVSQSSDMDDSIVAEQTEHLVTIRALRNMLMEEVMSGDVVRCFHFDETPDIKREPFGVWGAEGEGVEETPNDTGLELGGEKKTHGEHKKPFYAIAAAVNNVSYEVAFVEVNLTDTAAVLQTTEVRIKALHEALSLHDRYGERPRGFIEFARCAITDPTPIPSLPLPNLSHIAREASSHLIAVAMALSLVKADITKTGSNVVDIGNIVKTLRLPIQLVCGTTMTVYAVHDYVSEYISLKEWSNITVTHRAITVTSNKATDLERNLLVMLDAHESNRMSPTFVIACCFDVSVALKIRAGGHAWGIIAGYDPETNMLQIADAKPKKFQRTWQVSTGSMYDAMCAMKGGGYLTFTRSTGSDARATTPNSHRQSEAAGGLLNRMRTNVSRGQFVQSHEPVVKSFDFPTLAYSITAVGMALTRLGFSQATVTDIATNTKFDINFLLSDHLCMGDVQRVALEYSRARCNAEITVAMTFLELDTQGDIMSQDEFTTILTNMYEEESKTPNRPSSCTVLHFNPAVFCLSSESYGGCYGLIAGMAGPFVTVCDANPDAYYRAWKVRWADLYQACCDINSVNTRAHGFLRFTRVPAQATTPGRTFEIAKSKTTHPFKPPLSSHIRGVAFALCELGIPCSMEDLFYDTFEVLNMAFKRATTPTGGRTLVDKSHPWKSSQFKFFMVKNTVDVQLSVAMANSYLTHKKSPLKAEFVAFPTLEDFTKEVVKGAEVSCGYIVLIVYDARAVHMLSRPSFSVGLVQHVSADGKMITMCDANPTKYGERWSATVDKVFRACSDSLNFGVFRIGSW